MAAVTSIPPPTSVITIRAPAICRAMGGWKSSRRPTANCRSRPRVTINPGRRSRTRSRCSPRCRFIRRRSSSRRKTVTPACCRVFQAHRRIFGSEDRATYLTKAHADQKIDPQESVVMRQMISGLVAAIAVMTVSAVPAMACGGGLFQGSCSPCGQAYAEPCAQSYVAAPAYSGCYSGCGAAYERLPDPVQQYYYVNQGPTYSGPGNFAPYPTYQEDAVSGWGAYQHHPYYYGYHSHPHFRPWHAHTGYHGWGH